MKTTKEIREFAEKYSRLDAHIHTHLCDGALEMTVENIAKKAEAVGLDAVILTPHFHKQVSDETKTLYADTDETIFLSLREEIDKYERDFGRVKFLLSTEADIINEDGDISLKISSVAEMALDAVSPTLNYHPSLPYKFVGLGSGRSINELHDSGEYAVAAERIGGICEVLTKMYEAEIGAIEHCPYPAILGHFFAAHSKHPDRYTWFGAREEHLPLMKEWTRKVIDSCSRCGALIDITGVHLSHGQTTETKLLSNGFMADFQVFVLRECRKRGVIPLYGSDAHGLSGIGGAIGYYDAIKRMVQA